MPLFRQLQRRTCSAESRRLEVGCTELVIASAMARPVMEVKRVQKTENLKGRIVIEKDREDQIRTVTFAG